MPPQIVSDWFSPFCADGPKPLAVTGWIRAWLTAHFSDPGNFLENNNPNDPVQRFLWKPDESTGIVIESITKWYPELTESRPGIIIKRGGWKRIKAGIGNRYMGGFNASSNFEGYFENLWQGSHILFCIGNDGAETEILSTEVFREINEFSPVILNILNLKKFEVDSVGEMAQLEESRENFVVPISINYIYSEVWQIKHDVAKINKINIFVNK